MASPSTGSIGRRRLGKSDLEVSIIGMGGFHIGSADSQEVATEMVQRALDEGINFFDNAWEYHDGQSEEWLGKALGSRRIRRIRRSPLVHLQLRALLLPQCFRTASLQS